MKEVNADLYEFLNNHKTGMCCINNKIEAWTFIPFDELDDFQSIVEYYWFEEGGIDCKFQENSICINIIDFIEGEGHLLSSYKNCFNENDWEQCEKLILESEEE